MPKIYLDTSAISHLEQPEKPFEQRCSQGLFARIRKCDFAVYLSRVVFEEINACTSELRGLLLRHIAEIEYHDIMINHEVENLAKTIIARGVLPSKSVSDSQHIAAAIVTGCDYIVSWNMKHMSNVHINKSIRHITIDEGYKDIMLVPPLMLVEEGAIDDE